MTINPSTNRSIPPAFHELDANAFEEMSCALFEKEPGICTADLYRTTHQPQLGIDIIAQREDRNGIEVASCKCYGKVNKGNIPQWSDEFLKHWESNWKAKKVQRFILIVASAINSMQREAETEIEKARFSSLGVIYEVWAPRQLQEKIRHFPGLVSQYLGAEFISRLCGITPSVENTYPAGSAALSSQLVAQLGDLQHALSGEVEKRLDTAFVGILRGNLDSIDAELLELRNGKSWIQLIPETQARVIRLLASLRLQRGDINGATRFAEEADAIAKPVEPRLRALLATRQIGAERGLEILGQPVSREGVQLQVALLLEAGRIDDALELLEMHPTLKEEHSETERLKAVASMLLGRREESLAAIRRAEELAPDQPAIQRVGGIIRYACALSPIVTAEWYMYPNPVDLDLVREDDDGRALLCTALSVFEKLVIQGQNEEQRILDETWAIACQCNLRDRLKVAEEHCKDILDRDPTHAGAIEWALARGFEFNRAPCKKLSRELLEQGKGTPNQIFALAWLMVSEGKVQKAEDLVNNYSDRFNTAELKTARDRWLADLTSRKKYDPSSETNDALSNASRMSLLLDHANRTLDWKPLERFYEVLIATEPLPVTALKVAQLIAASGHWEAIASDLDALLRFETAEAVRISVFAAFNTKRPNLALKILEEHQSAFPVGGVPHELRVLRIKALDHVGDKGAALHHASMLAAESATLPDRLIKAKMLVQTGNLSAALPIIREATNAGLLTPTGALGLAQVIALEDTGLARSLFRHAKNKGIPEEQSTTAFDLACRLGIENEAAPFLEVMGRLAQGGTGIVQLVTLDDLIEQSRHWQEDAANLQQSYFSGVMPVHLFVGPGNLNLGRLFRLSKVGESTVSSFSPTFIRHGARPANLKVGIPIASWRIYLDITGLLLATQLDLLDLLEQLPHPISVSSALPEALYGLEIKSRHNQPGRVASLKAILEAVKTSRVSVANLVKETASGIAGLDSHQSAAVTVSRRTKGIVVEHHLPKDIDNDTLACFTTMRDVVDGLFGAGALDTETYAGALSLIGTYSVERKGNPPLQGTQILFLTNTLTVLANAGLLEAVLTVYRVQVDSKLPDMAQGEIENADEGEELAGWLAALRRRIGEGIENGRYTTLPVHDDEDCGDKGPPAEEDDLFSTPLMKCLIDLLKAPQKADAVVWIDDRNLTGYQQTHIKGNPIVGIYEVLNALSAANLISKHEHRNILLRLRASNVMFLPLEPKEVLEHLSKAPVQSGKIAETAALATIRRYLARTMLLEEYLKVDESIEALKERPAEINLLMDTRRLAESCIVAQWVKPGLPDEIRRARSSWIWSALRCERFSRLPLGTEDADATRTISALLFCALLTGVLRIVKDRSADPDYSRRKAYLQWVDDEILGARFESDPLLADDVVRMITQMLVGLVDFRSSESNTPEATAAVKRYLRIIVQLFPDKIQQKLSRNSEFCLKLGITTASIVAIGDVTFKADRFWASVVKAIVDGRSCVCTLDKRRVEITGVPGRENTVILKGAVQCEFSDPALQVLNRSVSQRRGAFRDNPAWLDIPDSDRLAVIDHIISTECLGERMHLLEELRDASVSVHYVRLIDKFSGGIRLSSEEFQPPAVESLLKHLRLSQGGASDFLTRLDSAAEALISEQGACFAFHRLSGLPVPTPQPIIRAFFGLTPEKRRDALAKVSASVCTPLQLIHVWHLHHIVGGQGMKENDQFVNQIVDSWLTTAPTFVAVLRWTDAAFRNDICWTRLPAADRLALVWVHADRLTDIMISKKVDLEKLAKSFNEKHPDRPFEQMMRLDTDYVNAVANPELSEETSLLFHGIGYVLGSADADQAFSQGQLEKLRGVLSVDSDGNQVPSPWLYINQGSAPNELGSFLGNRPRGIFDAALDPTVNACSQALENVIVQLEQMPGSSISWLAIWAFGRPILDDQWKIRLNAILRKVDLLESIRQGEDGNGIILFQIIGNCCVRLGNNAALSEVLSQLRQSAAYYATKYPARLIWTNSTGQDEAMTVLRQLLEGAASLSQDDDISEGLTRFGEIVVSLANEWPGAVSVLREVVENILSMSSGKFTRGLWKSWVILRSF
jgi:tetratricopeptide (TPR) repeat protein